MKIVIWNINTDKYVSFYQHQFFLTEIEGLFLSLIYGCNFESKGTDNSNSHRTNLQLEEVCKPPGIHPILPSNPALLPPAWEHSSTVANCQVDKVHIHYKACIHLHCTWQSQFQFKPSLKMTPIPYLMLLPVTCVRGINVGPGSCGGL